MVVWTWTLHSGIRQDAPDQLLLSESVCQQLGIVNYYRNVRSHSGAHKARYTDKKVEEVKVTTQVIMVRTVHLEYCCAGED